MKNPEEAAQYEHLLNKSVDMFDLPDGNLWCRVERVAGEWVIVVDFEPFEAE